MLTSLKDSRHVAPSRQVRLSKTNRKDSGRSGEILRKNIGMERFIIRLARYHLP